MKKLATILILLFVSSVAHARIYIPIDQPSEQKFPIAIPDIRGGGIGEEIAKIIRNDMTLSGYFRLVPESAYQSVEKKEGISQETIRFDYWAAIEALALVKGEVKKESGNTVVTLRLFDTMDRQMLVGKQYKADKKHMREVAHRFSDEIMESLTAIRGVFNTRITYTVQSGKGSKDIYVMDMDGNAPTAVTKSKSLNFGSNWSPEGTQLVFTSYMKGNPDLYTASPGKKNFRRITSGGANITPKWSPDGKTIALSSSIAGINNIFAMPPGGGKMLRLTKSEVIDVSPAWSADGASLVFASERAGGLHLYRIPVTGGSAQRLTFVGYQNDMPSCSPLGDKIVFAGRDGGTFDIFIMNTDGSNIQRLTVGTGSNEHPYFSPDGRFVTFSSTRGGAPAIFLMRADGSNQTKVSEGNGMLPSWGPRVE
ncbi:MAG: Tol-Pal system beta propeller repeat protein TolB [Pseudomonadota bacterium]